MTITALAQSTSKTLLELKEPTELAFQQIIQSAIDEAVAPHSGESASCKQLVNEVHEATNKALLEKSEAVREVQVKADALSERLALAESEVDRLREELSTSVAKLSESTLSIETLSRELAALKESGPTDA